MSEHPRRTHVSEATTKAYAMMGVALRTRLSSLLPVGIQNKGSCGVDGGATPLSGGGGSGTTSGRRDAWEDRTPW